MDTTFPDDPLSIFGSQNENSSYTEKKIKTESQVKELDNFITSVQEVVTKSDLSNLFQELEDAAKHANANI